MCIFYYYYYYFQFNIWLYYYYQIIIILFGKYVCEVYIKTTTTRVTHLYFSLHFCIVRVCESHKCDWKFMCMCMTCLIHFTFFLCVFHLFCASIQDVHFTFILFYILYRMQHVCYFSKTFFSSFLLRKKKLKLIVF